MAAGGKSKSSGSGADSKGKKRKHYLPHNKPVKKKGYPLRPGVQGFFITCDGGREHQAAREAINVIDSFFEELVDGDDAGVKSADVSAQPANKKIKFDYSESSSDEDDNEDDEDESKEEDEDDENAADVKKSADCPETNADIGSMENEKSDAEKKVEKEDKPEEHAEEQSAAVEIEKNGKSSEDRAGEPPAKKQCLEQDSSKGVVANKKVEMSVDKLIEAELAELSDKNKRRFFTLDSGCNGVIFVQMRKHGGEPGPSEIAQHIMKTAASTRKHMSRFILRVLPIEVTCYASEEEISRAIKPLIEQYFPIETENPQKFAVLYDARANSGIDRMKIINAVAKSIPGPHKVDLNNPDKSIVVQIVKTVCLIGVVEKYKELQKFNLRQLTSSKPTKV